MILPAPITIQPPTITRSTGEVRVQKPITLAELDITIIDNAKRKTCEARIRPCPRPVTLWAGAAYDAAGDYTQAQAEAKVMQALGPDIKAGLEGLFVRPARP
jgi:hypothetical protein